MSDTDIEIELSLEESEFIKQPITDIFMSDEDRQACATYLKKEIEAVESNQGREDRMERVAEIRKQRVAIPEEKTKSFPWPNAANIRPPLALEKTNTVATKLLSMFSNRRPLFTFSTDDPDYVRHATAITKHVQKLVENPNMINLYAKNWDILYDTASLGTSFLKVPFVIKRMRFKRKGAEGVEDINRIVKACPDVHRIEFEDFLTRAEWHDIEVAPWVAVRYYVHKHQLDHWAQLGYYQDVEAVYNQYVAYDAEKIDSMENMGITASNEADEPNRIYRVYEANIFWDTDGDGVEEDIVVHIEVGTGTILRADYNDLGIRDYVRIPYINIPGLLYALGVGEIVMPLQIEADALHNMRIDGHQLAMLPFIITSMSSSFGNSLGLTPGKIVKAQNPREDIVIEKFPDISMSAIQAEGITREYADRASGASNTMMGEDVGGQNRVGATGTQYLGSQAQSFLDTIGKQIAEAYSKIGMLILFQLVKNSDNVTYDMLDPADAALCQEVYNMNVEDLPTVFKFNAEVTSVENTEAVRRQQAGQLWGLYMSYGDKMAQIAGQLANPAIMQQAPRVAEVLSSYAVGLTKLMKAMLESFDEGEVSSYLPYIDDLEENLKEADIGRDKQLQGERAAKIGVGSDQMANGGTGPVAGGSGIAGNGNPGQPISVPSNMQAGSGSGEQGQPPVGDSRGYV